MAFLAPLGEMALTSLAPELESLIGAEAAKVLTPLARQGIGKVASSGIIGKGLSKLGNTLFGRHSKTARKLMKKGSSVAGVAFDPRTQGLLKGGMGVAQDLGMVDKSTADNILGGYNKALSLHDKMSQFNKKRDPLKGNISIPKLPDVVRPMLDKALEANSRFKARDRLEEYEHARDKMRDSMSM